MTHTIIEELEKIFKTKLLGTTSETMLYNGPDDNATATDTATIKLKKSASLVCLRNSTMHLLKPLKSGYFQE